MKSVWNYASGQAGALAAHLAGDTMTLAYLWEVKRVDGTILGFTTHDQQIVYDAGNGDGPVTYLAATGMMNTAAEGHADLSVDSLESAGFLDSESITEVDIRGSKYDDAEIIVRLVNWADLAMGFIIIRQGFTGNVKFKNGLFTAELRGLSQKLTTTIGGTYGEICRADLFSNPTNSTSQWLCNANRELYVQQGTLSQVLDNRTLVPAASPGLESVGGVPPIQSVTASPTIITQSHRENDWVNPANAGGSSGFATATLYGSNTSVNKSSLLQLTGFNFSALPAGAIIVGFGVSDNRRQTAGTSAVYDDVVTLLGLTGTLIDHSAAADWSAAPAGNYGGNDDLWGATNPTVAQVQSSGFGVELGCECTLAPGTGADVELNGVTLTVYFLLAAYPGEPGPAGSVSIVQTTSSFGAGAAVGVFLPSAPTPGNLLLAICSSQDGSSGPMASCPGFTQLGAQGTGPMVWVGSRTVVPGDGQTWTFNFAGSVGGGDLGVTLYEISGAGTPVVTCGNPALSNSNETLSTPTVNASATGLVIWALANYGLLPTSWAPSQFSLVTNNRGSWIAGLAATALAGALSATYASASGFGPAVYAVIAIPVPVVVPAYPAAAAGWFNDGIISFTSGACDGVKAEIKSWDGATLILFLSLPVLPAPGDSFEIEPGCNKGSDCQSKFQNIVNFRGEPFIPGMDQLLDYAD